MGVVRRVLRGSERDAISFAFGHSCAGCRKLLQPDWHADHILIIVLRSSGNSIFAYR
jgi:hypothetical protein